MEVEVEVKVKVDQVRIELTADLRFFHIQSIT